MGTYLKDLTERVVMTFVVAAVAVLPANAADLTDLTALQAAAFAGLTAVLTLIKGIVARWTGPTDSAGLGT